MIKVKYNKVATFGHFMQTACYTVMPTAAHQPCIDHNIVIHIQSLHKFTIKLSWLTL